VATVEEVKRQWRKRLFDAHPDQGGDVDEFKRVFAEYERAISMAT
jgi:curved DNA-binding protein CbpA